VFLNAVHDEFVHLRQELTALRQEVQLLCWSVAGSGAGETRSAPLARAL